MELCDITLADYIVSDRWLYSADEKLDRSVAKMTNKERQLEESQQLWKIIIDVVSGLEFLHENNTVHRDLKPNNGTWTRF